ncbi:unnamed protein product [Lota lota]
MTFVGHEHAAQLLHNKCVIVIGDSIQRSVYKDLVLLLQRDSYLSSSQLRSKGELTFESDALVEGGCHDNMHNGTQYREVRQFRSQHHLVRFYFVTRVFSRYMLSVLEDLRRGPPPDMVVVNSCLWDISRYKAPWVEDYMEHLHRFFRGLTEVLPQETLVVWNLTMPLGHKILGGFLTPEVASRAGQLRFDVVEANFCSSVLAAAYGADVLDLHFSFRFSLQQRTRDGIHWNAVAHRRMSSLLLRHAAAAWGVRLPPASLAPAATAWGVRLPSLAPASLAPAPAATAVGTKDKQPIKEALQPPYQREAYSLQPPYQREAYSLQPPYQREAYSLQPPYQREAYSLQPPYQREAYSHRTAREDGESAAYRAPATPPNSQAYQSAQQRPPQYVMRTRHTRRVVAPYSHRRHVP